MYDQAHRKGPKVAVALLLNPKSSIMAHFESITVSNENLTGDRLDAHVVGKYWQKAIPKMAKLASFYIK